MPRIFRQYGVDVAACVLKELVLRVENDERYVTVTENAELHRFLHESIFALRECDLAVTLVNDAFDANLLTSNTCTRGRRLSPSAQQRYTRHNTHTMQAKSSDGGRVITHRHRGEREKVQVSVQQVSGKEEHVSGQSKLYTQGWENTAHARRAGLSTDTNTEVDQRIVPHKDICVPVHTKTPSSGSHDCAPTPTTRVYSSGRRAAGGVRLSFERHGSQSW